MTKQIPWNKGKRGVSEETSKRMSESAKQRVAKGILPDNTGKSPWNKGLEAESDTRVAAYANKQRGQIREGNYLSGESHPNWQDKRTEYIKYRYAVQRLTESTYNTHIEILNPNNYPRTRAGIAGGYQLDHIVSVHHGFVNNIPPEELAKLENLQLLSWEENRRKGYKIYDGD